MESQLSANAFWKIFLLAVVPNGLFDLAGLVCGASEVPMWEFFIATWTAKALVRTPLQTCGLAMAVVAIANAPSLFPSDPMSPQTAESAKEVSALRQFLETWGKTALAKFLGEDEYLTEAGTAPDSIAGSESLLSWLVFGFIQLSWTCLTVCLFGFFVIGTIEQIAQHQIGRAHV